MPQTLIICGSLNKISTVFPRGSCIIQRFEDLVPRALGPPIYSCRLQTTKFQSNLRASFLYLGRKYRRYSRSSSNKSCSSTRVSDSTKTRASLRHETSCGAANFQSVIPLSSQTRNSAEGRTRCFSIRQTSKKSASQTSMPKL